MGTNESGMKIGSLIKYYSIDDEISYGIVTAYSATGGEAAVQVHWIDDGDVTLENIRNLLDPDVEFISIINEAR